MIQPPENIWASTYGSLLFISALLFIITIIVITRYIRISKKRTPSKETTPPQKNIENNQYIKSAYQPTWLFTFNEKDVFYKLYKIVEEENMKIFAKVRLLDLVTPVRNHPKYKTNLYKIQAKHVDFVITQQNLVAKYIIELDDSSHNTKDRKERDEFVDLVLKTCGYKVLHIRGIQEDIIRNFLKS